MHILIHIDTYCLFVLYLHIPWKYGDFQDDLVFWSSDPIGFPSDSHGHKKTFTLGAARLTWIPSVFPSQLLGLPVIPLISRYFKTPKTPKTRQLFEITWLQFFEASNMSIWVCLKIGYIPKQIAI